MNDNILWRTACEGIDAAIAECAFQFGESPPHAFQLLKESAETIKEFFPNKPLLLGQVLGEYLAKAANEKKPDAVVRLAELGANADWRTKDGYTPLQAAVLSDTHDMIRCLVSAGADINAPCTGPNIATGTAVHLAVSRAKVNSLRVLLALDADVNAYNLLSDAPETPLHLAARRAPAQYGTPEEKKKHAAITLDLVESLLANGAEPWRLDKDGYTPTLRAVQYAIGSEAILSLLQAPADYSQEELNLMLLTAVRGNQLPVIEAAVHVGADVLAKFNGKSILKCSENTVQSATIELVNSLTTLAKIERSIPDNAAAANKAIPKQSPSLAPL
jgi:ankyrin repeat protein